MIRSSFCHSFILSSTVNHLGQKDQKRKVSTVSVMLDASGYEDNPKLQAYIDKWQAHADEIQNACSRRNLGDGNGSESTTTIDRANISPRPSFKTGEVADDANRFFSPMTAFQAVHDKEHRDGTNGNAKKAGLRRAEEAANGTDPEEERGPRRKMFPYDLWPTIYFYRYMGQLTMPPCSEIVVWRILDEPLLISRKQFKQLGRLLTSYVDPETCESAAAVSPHGENYRPLESINHEKQEMTHCTEKDFTFWQYPPDQQ